MGEPILTVNGLRAGYGATEVRRGVDLQVGAGEIVAVLGSNGAGKSTLNRAISGVLRASRGSMPTPRRNQVDHSSAGRDGVSGVSSHAMGLAAAGWARQPARRPSASIAGRRPADG